MNKWKIPSKLPSHSQLNSVNNKRTFADVVKEPKLECLTRKKILQHHDDSKSGSGGNGNKNKSTESNCYRVRKILAKTPPTLNETENARTGKENRFLERRTFTKSRIKTRPNKYVNKKGFTPSDNRDIHLNDYINTLKSHPITENKQNVKENLTVREKAALKHIHEDETIVIKEADKGGAIVILDTLYYKQLVMEQLNDHNFYERIESNKDKTVMRDIKKFLKKHHESFTNNEIDYLTNFEGKTSNFYGLPKIHKSKEIQDAIKQQHTIYVQVKNPTDLKLRPIIAGPQSPTQRLINLIDILLKPYCNQVPSFVEDDIDFLNFIPENVPEDTILRVLMDSSLVLQGNSKISAITNIATNELRVDMTDFDGNFSFAQYSFFDVAGSASNYGLTVSGYSGTAGDSLSDHSGTDFSTHDSDNDPISGQNCAQDYKGGWWYTNNNCHVSNLNGLYHEGSYTPNPLPDGVVWSTWTGFNYSLRTTVIKIRRLPGV
ncbi:hypothetical protein ScPMuIL_010938 [Solemya velum]